MAETGPDDRPTLTGLARRLGQLPTDKRRAALEVSAALAGVSLRVSRDFVEAVAEAAKVLSADDIRHWGEFGRRLAMGNADMGSNFFSGGVAGLASVPEDSRTIVFQICERQLVLSSSTALKTFAIMPELAGQVADDALFSRVLKLAYEIALRSAKHSAEFLDVHARGRRYFDTAGGCRRQSH